MYWQYIDPAGINPELFDLTQVHTCKVKKYSGIEDVRNIRLKGWNLFADLLDECPVSGQQLSESTWFLYAAQGRS
ncbi:hypothetical protein [Desulfopila sp. IMCC35008]|uniref:hypothetical protein n=1 Tax=Desulfopila sp. IMCC35008 TaxID=2653858 RepID=UPI0013D87031|nr:hypothetical protein [Desulfopila sp. IMCC35008]